jgi:ComF family protein
MVVLYKNGNEHRLANLMSEYLFDCIPKHWFIWADCICWIPVDKKTLRRRGFDHMQVVAQELSAKLGLPAVHLLEKIPAKDQRKLSRQQRRQNLEGSFYYSEQAQNDLESPGSQSKNHQPTNILLIDDVLTTGATLDIAAQTLLEAGAKEVRVATVTRVW